MSFHYRIDHSVTLFEIDNNTGLAIATYTVSGKCLIGSTSYTCFATIANRYRSIELDPETDDMPPFTYNGLMMWFMGHEEVISTEWVYEINNTKYSCSINRSHFGLDTVRSEKKERKKPRRQHKNKITLEKQWKEW